jgi:muramoyltetrapeptide carboxypeptidase
VNKIPHYLKKGDKVALVATARKISPDEIQHAVHTLQKEGYEVILSPVLFEEEHQFAGTDEIRREGLQWALDDAEIKAILCVRGGYGSVRIIDRFDFTKFTETPKWICGYSDVTVLHSHIFQNFEIPTLHSTMPINFPKDEGSTQSLLKALRGERIQTKWEKHALNRNGNCEGIVVGGNLSLLYALSGSMSDIDTEGRILFLEDLDEYLYHIDRMMMQLKRSGKLSNLKGLLIGGMSEMKDNAIPFGKNAFEIIKEAVKEYEYPIYFGFPAGHEKLNLAFKLGMSCKIKCHENEMEFLQD